MLDLWKRWVQFHELYLKSEPEYAPLIKFETLVPHWVQRIKAGQAYKLIQNDTAAIRIADCTYNTAEKVLLLLVQYADTNVTDPVFSKLTSGDLRTEPKLEGEGVAVSAHVLISTVPYDDNMQMYKLVLEEIPGLGRSTLSPFIKSELKEISDGLFEFVDKDDNHKKKTYLPAAEIVGNPTKSLLDEMNDGAVLQSIELVKFSSQDPEFDEEGFYTETSRHIKLAPSKTNIEAGIEAIKRLWGVATDKGYDNVKVRYRYAKGKTKTATMGSDIGDIADALVLKTESVEATEVLAQCCDRIVVSIADQMLKLLKDQ